MGLIEGILGPDDVGGLPSEWLKGLVEEIRTFPAEDVSKTGDHLGPNLGVVELTIALHRVSSPPSDVLVFDTGYQNYVHKILTGRRDSSMLRQEGGLSRYPACKESVHDVVENSHASTVLPWADGIVHSFEFCGEDRRVVAVIGDGVTTGGMTWEALNNIAEDPKWPIVVVSNGNDRSCAPTAGGIVCKFESVRRSDSFRLNKNYEVSLKWTKRHLFGAGVPGRATHGTLHSIRKGVEDAFADAGIFGSLGLKHIGPVDGHSLKDLQEAFALAKDFGGPAVVHTITKKGEGHRSAEEDADDRLHAVGHIHPETGLLIESVRFGWTTVFVEEIAQIAREREDVVGVTAAMPRPVGLGVFADAFPERVIDIGIVEQHALMMAAGLAYAGCHPVVALYSTLTNRGFD